LFFPLGLGAIWPDSPEIAGWIDSMLWALAATGVAWIVSFYLRRGAND
jgi:hypothetical protein